MKHTENILGYAISKSGTSYDLKQIADHLEQQTNSFFFACANPHSIEVAQQDAYFKEALQNADLLTPDGIGIVLASKILNGSIPERVTGSDIFLGLNAILDRKGGYRCFFLGSTDKTLAAIRIKMANDFPNVTLAGTWSPPFKHEFSVADSQEMLSQIAKVKPDVLWVGMTAPKQEKWIYQHLAQIDARFVGAIGAVFDFYTGNVKRSPMIFQKLGLEWLPRLLQQPRRLWRRNLVSNPRFMMRVLAKKILD